MLVGCALFAAISGSSAATVATVGKMSIPELEKEKISRQNFTWKPSWIRNSWFVNSPFNNFDYIWSYSTRIYCKIVYCRDFAGNNDSGDFYVICSFLVIIE